MNVRVYLDTNMFIGAFEGGQSVADRLLDFFAALRQMPGAAVTSELTLAELFAMPRSGSGMPKAQKRRLYSDLLIKGGFIDLVPVTRTILIETADLRERTNHHLADAIHIVTAVGAGCSLFMSNDRDAHRLPAGLHWVGADPAGVAQALATLHA